MITVTCVRHGESTDNLRQVWAGWKDAPLSQHGMNQARAAGEYFGAPITGVKIHAIYASPLLRAFTTAQQIQAHQTSEPKPPLTSSDLIREQHWGDAEGKPFSWDSPPSSDSKDEVVKEKDGKYPALTTRTSRFPNGESSEDVAQRVDTFISEYIIPHVLASLPDEEEPLNIFVVSHGIAISELIGAFLRRDPSRTEQLAPEAWRGLMNTAWTRLIVSLGQDAAPSISNVTLAAEEAGIDKVSATDDEAVDTGRDVATRVETDHPPPTTSSTTKEPPLIVRIALVNQHSHLDNVKRQGGGIGSAAHDPKQSSIKDFFGGGGASKI